MNSGRSSSVLGRSKLLFGTISIESVLTWAPYTFSAYVTAEVSDVADLFMEALSYEHRQFQGNNLGNLSDNELSAGGTFVDDIKYVLY